MEDKPSILYVDDEEINLMLFEANFREKYKVITADSGKQALKLLEKISDISVVISDMRMPKMNGIEFIKKAKQKYPKLSFYILTGYDINQEISSALNNKLINNYFRKPFNIEEISGSINVSVN
jgi:two-component system response regulator (stage 0 sporulation protein F)